MTVHVDLVPASWSLYCMAMTEICGSLWTWPVFSFFRFVWQKMENVDELAEEFSVLYSVFGWVLLWAQQPALWWNFYLEMMSNDVSVKCCIMSLRLIRKQNICRKFWLVCGREHLMQRTKEILQQWVCHQPLTFVLVFASFAVAKHAGIVWCHSSLQSIWTVCSW